MDIGAKVKEIAEDILDLDAAKIVPQASFLTDLEASSIDLVEIIAAVENEFDLEILDEEIAELRTVQTLIDYIEKRVA